MIIDLIQESATPWVNGIAVTLDALVYLWAIFCLLIFARHIYIERKESNDLIMAREKSLVHRIAKAVRDQGGRPIKYHGSCYSEAGVPDLLVAYKGAFVFFEVKLPGEKPSAIQSAVMDELKDAGAIGGVVYSVMEAMCFLQNIT